MVETHWAVLGGKEIRYNGRTWELTGLVDVRGSGDRLEVEAVQVDDVRHGQANLRFEIENPPGSLNPGDLGDHFDELKRDGDRYLIVAKEQSRIYRYELQGLEPK